ncbi:MAG: hypothetical protein NZ920_00800 [Aigarchaeota archaeon]|nr:hypothetical protein [Aigarchaeota archaeon]MDW8092981.1 hypothetical protein [Nitrososphaerota archaeon]
MEVDEQQATKIITNIIIDHMENYDRVTIFKGRLFISDEQYKFDGIAVMTVGGPTVNVSLDDESTSRLRGNFDVDALLVELQKHIIDGNFRMSTQQKSDAP